MHSYLRAVGFSKLKDKEELSSILAFVEDCYQSEKSSKAGDGADFAERKKAFAPGMGIMLRGRYNDKEQFEREYYYPYFEGRSEKFYDDVIIERHAEKESYAGVCDDLSLGISLIFYLQNAADYLCEKRLKKAAKSTATVRFSALSTEGKILLPVLKEPISREESTEALYQRTRMIQAARAGDETAIENLTMEDMDMYSVLSERITREDLFSIVSTYFMPCGVECDHYNVMGEILQVELEENTFTGEEIYVMKIEAHDLILEVCINREDLLGEPLVGRRFKGVIWLQGEVIFH